MGALSGTFSGTQVRIAEIERLQSLFKVSMTRTHYNVNVHSHTCVMTVGDVYV